MCPFCTNQSLHILQTASGLIEQCPTCSGLLLPWSMLASFSEDASFLKSIEDSQAKLLPTGRICPHCLGRLAQGKLTDKPGVVTVCTACKLLWTDLYDLEQLDAVIASALRTQIENPSVVPTPNPSPFRPGEPSPFPSLTHNELLMDSEFLGVSPKPADIEKQYKALEKTLREEWEKREEERNLLNSEVIKKTHGEHTQRLEALQASIADLEKKRLDQEAHLRDLKDHFTQAQIQRDAELSKRQADEMKKNKEALDKAVQEQLNAAQVEYARHLQALVAHIDGLEKKRQSQDNDISELKKRLEMMETQRSQPGKTHAPEPVQSPPPVKAPIEIPKPSPVIPRALPPEIKKTPPVIPKPVELPVAEKKSPDVVITPIPNPQAPKVVLPKPAPAVTKTPSLVTNLLGPLKALWTPRPKSTVAPTPKISPPTPAPIPTPVPKVTPAPTPAIPAESSQKKSGFLKTLKGAWNPTPGPKSVEQQPKKEIPQPVVKSPPVVEKAPVATPLKPVVPSPVSTSTNLKKKINWGDLPAAWLPRVFPVLVYLIAGGIEDDWGRAILWALAAWSIAYAIRLWRMYPRGVFYETTVQELAKFPGGTAWKGRGVSLKGQLQLESATSKRLHFKDATGVVPLNRLGRLEFLPLVGGLMSPGQYPTGDFELKGWYRQSAIPCIEVAEARGDKTSRKSFVKVARWILAGLGLFFGVLLLFVIE